MEYKLKASKLRSLNESPNDENITTTAVHEDETKSDKMPDEVIKYVSSDQILGNNDAYIDGNNDNLNAESMDRVESLKVSSLTVAPYSEIDLVPKKDIIQQRSPRDSVIYEPVVDVHSGYCHPNPELPVHSKHYQGIYPVSYTHLTLPTIYSV